VYVNVKREKHKIVFNRWEKKKTLNVYGPVTKQGSESEPNNN
jgi:hypothetical protein